MYFKNANNNSEKENNNKKPETDNKNNNVVNITSIIIIVIIALFFFIFAKYIIIGIFLIIVVLLIRYFVTRDKGKVEHKGGEKYTNDLPLGFVKHWNKIDTHKYSDDPKHHYRIRRRTQNPIPKS